MKRLTAAFLLITAGLFSTPAVASAQFFGAPLRPMSPLPSLPGLPSLPSLPALPSLRPLSPIPNPYAFIPRVGARVPIPLFGGVVVDARRVAVRSMIASEYYAVGVAGYLYGQNGAYTTGSPSTRSDLLIAAQREVMRAQREAALPSARDQLSGQSNSAKGAVHATPDTGPQGPPDALRKALAASTPADVASGEALNEVLKEITRVDTKGANVPSGYVPSLLLEDMRFTGSPAADLLNFTRKAGSLPFPSAFDDPALAGLRKELERDFALAAGPVQAGKAPEGAKLTRLEFTFQRVQDAAGPVIKNLPFEEATAARQFLNRMAGAIKAMKGNTAVGLIDSKWAAQGLSTADLVRHMNRHKLQFGPAPSGNEESYMTMHRNLVTYLFVLTQPKK